MSQWTPTAIAKEPERERAHSSCRTAVIMTSAPAPPYRSSYSRPRKPSSPMRRKIAFGMRPAVSHASTCGITSFSTKDRTVARNMSCCSSKTFTSLYPLQADGQVVFTEFDVTDKTTCQPQKAVVMSPAPDWGRASSAGFAGAIEIWGRHRRGPPRPPPTKTCRAARRRPSHAPPSGAPTIQWAGVARERSLVLPVLLTAIVGLGALSIDMFLPSLPAMTLAFGSDAATAQLTVTLFLAGLAAAQLVWGPLSDRLGRRRVLLAGLAVYATAGTACAFAPSMSLLIAARVVQALGAGSGPVIARAVVRDLYEPERAARVLAAMGTAQALTPILAPIIGGWVHVLAGWRAVFVVLGAFGSAFLLTAWRIVPETNVYAGARAAEPGGRVAALLRHPRYAAYVAAAALMFSGQFAFITGSSFALITILGVSPTAYGLCFGAVAVGLMAGNVVSVRVGPRLGIDTMIRGGTVIGAAAGVVMAALAWAGLASVATVIAPMFCYAFGLGWVLPNAMAGAIGPFPRMAGLAAAGAGFVQLTGSALYAIAVSRTYDGTLRPMTTAVATAGLAAFVTFAWLLRRRVVLDNTDGRVP